MASKNIILTEVSEGDLLTLLQVCRKERKRTGQVAGHVLHDWLQTNGSRHQVEAEKQGVEQAVPVVPSTITAGRDNES